MLYQKAEVLLRRRDFVAQAVSHYKARHTGVFHVSGEHGEAEDVPFDAREIAQRALTVLAAVLHFGAVALVLA